MFRQAASRAAKLIVGVGSIQFGAATVALTDKQLAKKPDWYKQDVQSLEKSFKALSKYSFIENEEVLNVAEDCFKRYADSKNPEVLWRLSRALAEKAELTKDHAKKIELLHEALKWAEQALTYEGKVPNAQIHKWFGIAAIRYAQVDKKAGKCPTLREKTLTHLKRATELNPQDPIVWTMLGIFHYNSKDYKDAVVCFEKAESIKPEYSAANLFYYGDSQRILGQKSEAIEKLKKAYRLPVKNQLDGQGKSKAKGVLLKNKLKQEDIMPDDMF